MIPLSSGWRWHNQKSEVYVYVATSINELYCFADNDGFGFGSEPHYGLFIDHSLRKGFSFPCQTFKNEPLSSENYFTIDKLEVWGFQPQTEDQMSKQLPL